ncbi:hypothetical protein ACFLT2_00575 [Acidobacteriota bacterium]
MDLNSTLEKSSFQNKTKGQKRERHFELSLPVLVRGINAKGEDFEEKTKIASISAQEASFWLKNKVTLGTNINLSLDVPKTLVLESHLNLHLSGDVRYVQSGVNNKRLQLITLHLDKLFKIQSNS